MHCKGCSATYKPSEWKHFEEDDAYASPPPDMQEELCSHCLLSARQAYFASKNHPLEQQITDCQHYFYKEFSFVDELVAELQADQDYASITIQDIYE